MRTTASLLFLTALATAQTPSFSPFGTGCTFQGQTLSIGNVGLPRIGTTLRITYAGPNYTFTSGQQIARPHLGLGFGQAVIPLPAGLLPGQPTGCTGYILPDAMVATQPSAAGPQFDDFFDFAIPNDVGLVGVLFFAQWLTIHEQCGFAGCGYWAALTSDAAAVVIGQ